GRARRGSAAAHRVQSAASALGERLHAMLAQACRAVAALEPQSAAKVDGHFASGAVRDSAVCAVVVPRHAADFADRYALAASARPAGDRRAGAADLHGDGAGGALSGLVAAAAVLPGVDP